MSGVIIHRDHVAVPADPRLDAMIPHGKRFQHQGKEYVLVPHKLDETKVLRNLGLDVPPPILTSYNWNNDQPFDAQRMTAALITMNPKCFVLNGIGTGKTRASLYAFDYLRSIGQAKKLLVICPMSTMRQTWEAEVFRVFPHLKTNVLYGTKAERQKLLKDNADVYVINHDGVLVILPELIAATGEGGIDMIVADELSVYKDSQTKRAKKTAILFACVPRLVGMGATVIPKDATDCYGMMKVIDPKLVQMSFTRWREKVMRKITEFKWLPLPDALDTVHKYMQPAVRFTRDECYDLPPCQTITRIAPMGAKQKALYAEVAGECAADYNGKTIKAVNEADRINKLTQIALGTVYNTDKTVVELDCGQRLAVVEELVEQSASKVIVFTPYKASLRMLREHLSKRWAVATVSGDTPQGAREQIFSDFMQKADPQVLVAHPQCMSHGLTLTSASTIVWYGPPNSLETYEQANGRITRAGQKHAQLIAHVAATKLEEKVYERLQKRADMQGLLLEMFQRQEIGDYL